MEEDLLAEDLEALLNASPLETATAHVLFKSKKAENEREKMAKLKQTLEYAEDEKNELLDALHWHYNADPDIIAHTAMSAPFALAEELTPVLLQIAALNIFLQCVKEQDVADQEQVTSHPHSFQRKFPTTTLESSSKFRIHFTRKRKPVTLRLRLALSNRLRAALNLIVDPP
ncbi:hypothetical protein ARMGADRAFT_1026173 [Armillaria gallica]|uniref:Uncharacterized protein n=1 Tax=Armillaria gallica TaxID=47427 RepID=A0A2H3EF29_ARMGA|nr:hypothetical protein ARMGADRAFT_1026173 [Armillaria gallica]